MVGDGATLPTVPLEREAAPPSECMCTASGAPSDCEVWVLLTTSDVGSWSTGPLHLQNCTSIPQPLHTPPRKHRPGQTNCLEMQHTTDH